MNTPAKIPYGSALLRSTTRYGSGSEREGFLSPRSAATKGIYKPDAAPDAMSPDDETLMPAPSVTGEAKGPGGTQGTGTRGPALEAPPSEYGTPFMGNQPDIDFQAEQAINKRYLLRLEDIKKEEELLGNPQEKELEARKLTRALEDYQPAGQRPSLRFSQGGMMTEYLPDDRLPPDAPTVGDVRAGRANALAIERNPSVAAARVHEMSDLEREQKAAQVQKLYRRDVERARASGDPNLDQILQDMENDLNRRLATLGVKPPTLIDPRRMSISSTP